MEIRAGRRVFAELCKSTGYNDVLSREGRGEEGREEGLEGGWKRCNFCHSARTRVFVCFPSRLLGLDLLYSARSQLLFIRSKNLATDLAE